MKREKSHYCSSVYARNEINIQPLLSFLRSADEGSHDWVGAFTWVLIKIPVLAKAIIVNREISGYAADQSSLVLRACTVQWRPFVT